MIVAEDLGKQFGTYWAVDGVYLDVRPGQVLALLGQNGAGKTTTVRMLTSILKPTRGNAYIAGYDVLQHPERVRSSVGVLTEQHGLYLRMTGEEYLEFYGQIYGLNNRKMKLRITTLLSDFGLEQASNQRIGEYSKGMRQKLALARTLIHEPPVLLLDEPTSAMDPESAMLVRKSISSLRSRDRAIIICTHNLVEAEIIADHVAIIYRGRILISGTVKELKERLLGSPMYDVQTRNQWDAKELELPDGVKFVSVNDKVTRFCVPDAEETNPELLKRVVACGGEVIALQEVPRTLEEVYMSAMAQVENV